MRSAERAAGWVPDEAYAWLSENVAAYTDLIGEISDEAAGVRMRAESITIETPVELEIGVEDDGSVRIACAPPVYAVEATLEPVFHRLRFTAVADSRPQRGGSADGK